MCIYVCILLSLIKETFFHVAGEADESITECTSIFSIANVARLLFVIEKSNFIICIKKMLIAFRVPKWCNLQNSTHQN